jgi:hypothetical protein
MTFPKSVKRSGSISRIKLGNRISSFSYSELGIAEVDGISGKILASTTLGSTSRMLSNSEDRIGSRIDLAFSEETCKNDPPEVVASNCLLSLSRPL